MLDPCMGSGHFLVSALVVLAALRVAEEKLAPASAVDAVLRDNLFGLEIDPRCAQIAAFNLALSAWREGGHRALPELSLASSGLAPSASRDEWRSLAGDDPRRQRGMERLHELFEQAPALGSLLDPRAGGATSQVAGFADSGAARGAGHGARGDRGHWTRGEGGGYGRGRGDPGGIVHAGDHQRALPGAWQARRRAPVVL